MRGDRAPCEGVAMPTDVPALASPGLAISGDGDRLALEGVLDIHTLTELRRSLQHWQKQGRGGQARRALAIGKLSGLDTPGALFLCELRDKGVDLTGVRAEHKALLDLVCGIDVKPLPVPRSIPRWRQLVIGVGGAETRPGATRSTSSRSSAVLRALSARR